ncbi:TPA: ATP-binding protein [Acinetobacter baumannii]
MTFEDEGPGIDESHLKHLFKPFYRLEDSRSRLDGGTGLGLAVIEQLLKHIKVIFIILNPKT